MSVRGPVSFLRFFLSRKLADISLDCFLEPRLELRSVAEREEHFQPDEKWCQEQSLHQIVQQSGSSTLKNAVADELSDPGEDVEADSPVVGRLPVGRGEVISISCSAKDQRSEK